MCGRVIKRFVMHAKKTAFVVEHDFIMATYYTPSSLALSSVVVVARAASRSVGAPPPPPRAPAALFPPAPGPSPRGTSPTASSCTRAGRRSRRPRPRRGAAPAEQFAAGSRSRSARPDQLPAAHQQGRLDRTGRRGRATSSSGRDDRRRRRSARRAALARGSRARIARARAALRARGSRAGARARRVRRARPRACAPPTAPFLPSVPSRGAARTPGRWLGRRPGPCPLPARARARAPARARARARNTKARALVRNMRASAACTRLCHRSGPNEPPGRPDTDTGRRLHVTTLVQPDERARMMAGKTDASVGSDVAAGRDVAWPGPRARAFPRARPGAGPSCALTSCARLRRHVDEKNASTSGTDSAHSAAVFAEKVASSASA